MSPLADDRGRLGSIHPNLTVSRHPLVQHKLGLLRSRHCEVTAFAKLVEELALLMAYEATADLPVTDSEVETPLEVMLGKELSGKGLVLVPILRAGLGMVGGFRRVLPSARVGHIGLVRDEDTLLPSEYYLKLPPELPECDVFVLDPMLATGGSACVALGVLKEWGARRVRFVCLVAAPEGVVLMGNAHPDVPIYTAALDRGLNDVGYIVPGLGDAGDRLFGTD